ncbi:hypothetical protein SSX86_031248 [Deinandra increscens subsp. villosa]|uniref:Leucine-rich repeat-containing N-terminal plant-type domain-containing protein n=1 Tax=Deinandra increscens subsp. villosa TaxID=3103831 RepID=A0AAP0GIF4_9ASTR
MSGGLLTLGLKEDANTRLCTETERQALLDVKANLIDFHHLLDDWGSQEEMDCCKWVGVSCNNHTGHVTELDLGHVVEVNHFITFGYSFRGKISPSLQVLNQLQHLNLNYVDFQYNPLPEFWAFMSNLQRLHISGANLSGPIPYQLANLSTLLHLDLSHNYLMGSIPFFFGDFTSLTYLDLSGNQLRGVIPNSFGNFSSLAHLDLSQNLINGSLPNFARCSSLINMSVAHNYLNGRMPNFTRCTLLKNIDLSNNFLSGNVPKSVGELSNLEFLDVGHNFLNESMPNFIGCPSLWFLDMSSNELSGNVPKSLGQVSKLRLLDFSSNFLKGVISEVHFLNLTHLDYLDLSFNSLELNLSFHGKFPSQLSTINLQSCKLGPRFPMWIKTQKFFIHLDISNASISDDIPTWFWGLSSRLKFINLSSNDLKGMLPDMGYLMQFFDGYPGMDLSNNRLEGRVPFLPALAALNLSGNKFSGTLSFLCKIDGCLTFLDLSNNSFSGSLPDCWLNFQGNLVVLRLSNNNLSGPIPSSLGFLSNLESLYLRTNSFFGEVPKSLNNCTRLKFVDLSENKLSGVIPEWIGENLSKLYVLVLGSNNFKGMLPSQICWLSNLQVLDVSYNGLSGNIPRCFDNFTAMGRRSIGDNMTKHLYYSSVPNDVPSLQCLGLSLLDIDHDDKLDAHCGGQLQEAYYLDNTWVTWKGTERSFERSGLQLLKTIDLSRNNLSGNIPHEITSLFELVSLNLSMNKLHGEVSEDVGWLKSLESLDLSRNEFSGQIPWSLAQLNFLSYLDLSFNNLSGRIPTGSQLQRFNYTSYIGNLQLCGPPLTPQCGFPPILEKKYVEEDEDDFWESYYTSMGAGFSVGFLGLSGALIFNRSCRYFFFASLSHMKDWIYVTVVVHLGRLERKFRR